MMTPAELRRIALLLDCYATLIHNDAESRDLARKLREEADERQQRENWTKQEHD